MPKHRGVARDDGYAESILDLLDDRQRIHGGALEINRFCRIRRECLLDQGEQLLRG